MPDPFADAVPGFFDFLRQERGLREATLVQYRHYLQRLQDYLHRVGRPRNQRLAALRTFFEYIGQRFPERLEQAQKVAAIPRKRAQPPETIFLERDEIEATLAALPTDGRYALRDRALLVFLYNTGARVQEAADLRVKTSWMPVTPDYFPRGELHQWLLG